MARRLDEELAAYEYNPDEDDDLERSTVFSVAESVDYAMVRDGRAEDYYELKMKKLQAA